MDGWDFSRWKGGVGGFLVGRMGGVGGKEGGVVVISFAKIMLWMGLRV